MEELQVFSMCSAHFSRLVEAVSLIELYHIVNPEAESVNAHFEPGLEHSFIQVNLYVIDCSDALMFLSVMFYYVGIEPSGSIKCWETIEGPNN
jgi:hypothetical protein